MGFAGLSFFVNAAVVLLSAVVTSRLYGVEVVGSYALAIAPWGLLVSLSTVSEQVAMIRTLAVIERKTDEATGLFFAVLSASMTLTAVMAVPVFFISRALLDGPIDQGPAVLPAAVILAGYVVFENPGWNLESVLSAYSEGRRLFWARLSVAVSFGVVAVALRAVTDTVWGLTIATVASFAVGTIVRLVSVRDLINRRPTGAAYRAGVQRLPELLRFGVGLLPGQFFIGATLQLPLWLVANTSGLRAIGAFSRASTMAVRLNEAGFRINEMLFPDLVRARREGDIERLAATQRTVLRLALIVLVFLAAIAGGASEAVMNVFGDGFGSASGAFVALLGVHVCYVACSVVGTGFNVFDRPIYNSATSSIRFVVGVGLVAVLVPTRGITAAAFGLLVGYLVELAVRVVVLTRFLRRHADQGDGRLADTRPIDLMTVIRLALAYAAGFVVVRALAETVDHDLVTILVGGTLGTVAFVAAALATGLVTSEERARITRLRTVRGR